MSLHSISPRWGWESRCHLPLSPHRDGYMTLWARQGTPSPCPKWLVQAWVRDLSRANQFSPQSSLAFEAMVLGAYEIEAAGIRLSLPQGESVSVAGKRMGPRHKEKQSSERWSDIYLNPWIQPCLKSIIPLHLSIPSCLSWFVLVSITCHPIRSNTKMEWGVQTLEWWNQSEMGAVGIWQSLAGELEIPVMWYQISWLNGPLLYLEIWAMHPS